MSTTRERVVRLVESRLFQQTVLSAILLNAAVIGLRAWPTAAAAAGPQLRVVERTIIAIFVVEISLRLFAHGRRFFRDPWSILDVLVVGVALVSARSGLSVLRALRILRALRLVSAIPGMRMLANGLLRSLSIAPSALLLFGVVYYICAILATELYGATAPTLYGSIADSASSLFLLLLGNWTEVVQPVIAEHPSAWIFFLLFIATIIFFGLNIIGAFASITEYQGGPSPADPMLLAEIRALRGEIQQLRGTSIVDDLPTQRAAASPDWEEVRYSDLGDK